ncbi:MAG: DUF29 domain-containing protein [Candidatus Competibacteraceae bacterium]|nr:DUF29 domain-containing protein [Candidatus Competibacteraceae bacterium]
MTTPYQQDVVAWANEQVAFLRAGRWAEIDVEHIAEEIEDVGKSEQRELVNRVAVLLAHLLKWQFQPEQRGASGQITIRNQRRGIARRLERTPSLKAEWADPAWWEEVWDEATAQAAEPTGLSSFPEACPWTTTQILDPEWLP